MSNPKVCICIPCYNNSKTIADTLVSIFAQDYPNIVIKIFDNASTDDTVSIIRSFTEAKYPVELHVRKENSGAEVNFNSCIAHSDGEFSAIFHADDIYASDIISKQVDFLNRHPQSNAVSTHARFIDSTGSILKKRKMLPRSLNKNLEMELSKSELIEILYKYGNIITCPSVLFRTNTLKFKIEKFRHGQFRSSSDLDVWFRLLETGNFGFINKPLINYRLSNSSFSYNLSKTRTEDSDMFLVLDYYLKVYATAAPDKHYRKLLGYKNFLLMRDRAVTNFNRLVTEVTPYKKINLHKNIYLALASTFHLKSFFLSATIKLLVIMPFGRNAVKLLRRA